jgi:inorganic pyrophosphatase
MKVLWMKDALFRIAIEEPKGAKRRIHLDRSKGDKGKWLDLGPIKRAIPVNGGAMPVAYGFVIRTRTRDKETDFDEELDAILYSKKRFRIADIALGKPIATFRLQNMDHKVIFADDTCAVEKWADIPKRTRDLFIKFFGYKSRIMKIGDKQDAMRLIRVSKADRPMSVPKANKIVKIG